MLQTEILIKSHEDALSYLKEHPKKYHVIYISDPKSIHFDPVYKDVVSKAVSSLLCFCRDIDLEEKGEFPPTMDMVKKAIEWSEDKDKIIVCCFSGVSRSSALAYVIGSYKFITAEQALKVLNTEKHFPNLLIAQHGAAALKQPDVFGYMLRFREESISNMSENKNADVK